jgi:CHAD domain-containing protein
MRLAVHNRFALPEPAGWRLAAAGGAELIETWWDTPDLRLARNGVTLTHAAAWVLTLPGQTLTAPGPADAVPAWLAGLVTAWVREAALEPRATLRTERAAYRVDGGGERADLVDDTVSVVDGTGQETARYRELLLTPLAGDGCAVRDWLLAAGAVEGERTPRLVRALGQLPPSDLPAVPDVDAHASGGTVVTTALAAGVRRLLAADPAVRQDAPDAVHQLRVACRQLRSHLGTFAPLIVPEWAAGLRAELGWLAGELAPARDLEVQRERIAASAGADPLSPVDGAAVDRIDGHLAGAEARARAAVLAALDSPRYAALLAALVEAARAPELTAAADRPARQTVMPLVRRAWRKLARGGGALGPGAPDGEWHRVRVLAKRARYAAEAARPAAGKPAGRLAAAAESVQALLGDHQDAVLTARTLAGLASARPEDTEVVLTCGRLLERERARARGARARLPRVWRAANRHKVTGWLERHG